MTRSSINHFWEWFEEHQQTLFDLQYGSGEENQNWIGKLNIQLRKNHKLFRGLLEYEKGQATLVISVDGQKKYFKQVDELVANAPELPGWTITALMRPGMLDDLMPQLIERAEIDPDEFRFSFLKPKSNQVDLVVFHPDHTEQRDIQIFNLADQIIFNMLGERLYGNYIKSLDARNMSTAEPDKLEKLEIIPTLFNAGFVISANGELHSLRKQ